MKPPKIKVDFWGGKSVNPGELLRFKLWEKRQMTKDQTKSEMPDRIWASNDGHGGISASLYDNLDGGKGWGIEYVRHDRLNKEAIMWRNGVQNAMDDTTGRGDLLNKLIDLCETMAALSVDGQAMKGGGFSTIVHEWKLEPDVPDEPALGIDKNWDKEWTYPDNMALVPVDPTDQMIEAGMKRASKVMRNGWDDESGRVSLYEAYKAMIETTKG